MTMHNSSHLQRTAKGLRLKIFDSLLTPAFPTLARPTFNPFVFYRFKKNRGGRGPHIPFVAKRRAGSEERAGQAQPLQEYWNGKAKTRSFSTPNAPPLTYAFKLNGSWAQPAARGIQC